MSLANLRRQVQWLWKHRHKHDGENFQTQIQVIRQTVETQADAVAAGSSGAYVHLVAGSQTIPAGGEYVEFSSIDTLGVFEFLPLSLPSTEVTVLKTGYYDVAVTALEWESWRFGGDVSVWRNGSKVWPQVHRDGWSTSVESIWRADSAHAVWFDAGDTLRLFVDHGSGASQSLAHVALTAYLIDRTGETIAFTADPSGYRDLVLSHGPIAYWRLGETSGTVAVDETGNGHHGTYRNSPTLGVAGLIDDDPDTAVSFNRANEEYVSTVDDNDFDVSEITLEAWISTSASPADEMMIVSRDNGGSGQRVFQWRIEQSSGFVSFRIFANGQASALGVLLGSTDVRDGQTHHLVLTYDGSDAILYIDGVVDASDTLNAALNASSAPVRLAARRGTTEGDDPYSGVLDEVAIWGRVLTPTEVSEHFSVGSGT